MSNEKDILTFSLKNYHSTSVSEEVYSIRKIMIYYMNDLREDFSLHYQTFFIAVSIFDKLVHYDPKMFVQKKLRFIGLVILWISSKFEETDPLCLDDLFYVTEHKHSKEDFLDFEKVILEKIQYQIPHINSYTILEQYKEVYPFLHHKSFFKKCLSNLFTRTLEENVSSLCILEIIQNEKTKFFNKI